MNVGTKDESGNGPTGYAPEKLTRSCASPSMIAAARSAVLILCRRFARTLPTDAEIALDGGGSFV